MGFFKRKKADKELLKNESFEWMTVGEAVTREKLRSGDLSYTEIMERCEECCEQYADALARRDEVRNEISNLESRLQDLIRLDELSEVEKYTVEDMTKTLVNLIEERNRYEQREKEKITPSQYLMMERHEEEIHSSLEVLKDQENLRNNVIGDMHKLEREKDRLEDDLEQLKGKRVFYRQMSIAAIITFVMVFIVLTYLATTTKADLSLIFMLTAFMGALLATGIFLSYRKNSRDTRLTGLKINKAIKLTNTTKIKYVNSTNAIDFTCDKYGVDSYSELAYLWDTYCTVKAEREKYKKNTGKIDDLSDSLSLALTGLGIKTPEVMVCQPECIINRGERVEMRHRLNERRRTLKDRLDFAQVRLESTKGELLWMTGQFPEHTTVFENIMRGYGLYEFAPTSGHETT